jgi:predicted amidohydrolase
MFMSSKCITWHAEETVHFIILNLMLLYCRYRKFNLFGETGFTTTPEAEISILDTDFGVKFGTFTCFDLIFEKPAVQLVKEWGVTDIVFPTARFSAL